MPAKQLRVLLTVFFVRHVLGVAGFAWVTWIAYQVGLPLWWFMVIFDVIYGISVVYNGRKLVKQYKHRQAVEQARFAPSSKGQG
jgi:hypothetical protein